MNVKFNDAIDSLIRLRRNPALRGMAWVFVLRAATTVLNFVLISLAARTLGKGTFGTYSILFSAAGLFCVVATFGQQIVSMRSWSEYSSSGQQHLLKGAMIFTGVISLAGSALVAVPFYAWLAATHGSLLAAAVTFYLVALSIVLTTSHLVRTAIGVAIGDGISNLLLVVPPILYLVFCILFRTEAEISTIFLMMATGASTAILIHVISMWYGAHARFPDIASSQTNYDIRRWFSRSLKLWISNGLEASNQYADVLIIGFLMSPTIAGAYFVTTRIANAFAMATGAIYVFSTRHIPGLYYRRQFSQLNALLDSVAGVTLVIIAGGLLLILGGGHWLLRVFSEDYVSYYGALALLSLGTAAVAAAGPSGSILMLTGHEGRYLSIIGGTVLLRCAGFFILIPLFGITGAVAATTISFVWTAIMLRTSAKRLAGIDGSILRLRAKFFGRRVSLPAE
ncbi:MAG TPA: polysaccharide biosynthesis C-terminal domain-containing protein [Bradyrhizobium sp.]